MEYSVFIICPRNQQIRSEILWNSQWNLPWIQLTEPQFPILNVSNNICAFLWAYPDITSHHCQTTSDDATQCCNSKWNFSACHVCKSAPSEWPNHDSNIIANGYCSLLLYTEVPLTFHLGEKSQAISMCYSSLWCHCCFTVSSHRLQWLLEVYLNQTNMFTLQVSGLLINPKNLQKYPSMCCKPLWTWKPIHLNALWKSVGHAISYLSGDHSSSQFLNLTINAKTHNSWSNLWDTTLWLWVLHT